MQSALSWVRFCSTTMHPKRMSLGLCQTAVLLNVYSMSANSKQPVKLLLSNAWWQAGAPYSMLSLTNFVAAEHKQQKTFRKTSLHYSGVTANSTCWCNSNHPQHRAAPHYLTHRLSTQCYRQSVITQKYLSGASHPPCILDLQTSPDLMVQQTLTILAKIS